MLLWLLMGPRREQDLSQPLCSRPAAVNSSCLLLFLALAPWACVSQNETGSSRCCPGWSLCRAMQGWRQGQQPVPQWVSAPPTPSMVWEWRQAAGSHPGFSLWTLICKHTPSCRNIIARPKNRSPWAAWPRSGVFVGSVVLFLFLFSLHFFFFFSLEAGAQGSLDISQNAFSFSSCSTIPCEISFSKEVSGSLLQVQSLREVA